MSNKRCKISDKKLRKMVRNNIKHNRDCESHFWSGNEPPDLIQFTDLDLRDQGLSYADLRGTEFVNCDLRDASFYSSCLRFAKFTDCDLKGADFQNADLSNAVFERSNLFKVNFNLARLGFSSLLNLKIKDSSFCMADLSATSFVDAKLIEGKQDFAILFKSASLSCMNFNGYQRFPVARLDLDGTPVTISKRRCYISCIRFQCKRLVEHDADYYVVKLIQKMGESLIVDNVSHLADWWMEYGQVVIDCVKALRRGAKKAKVSE